MVYKKFQDLELSALGMGAMRLPLSSDNDADIDEKATAEMVLMQWKKELIIMIQHGDITTDSLKL